MLFRHCECPSKINNLKILFAQGAKYDNQNNGRNDFFVPKQPFVFIKCLEYSPKDSIFLQLQNLSK